MQKAARWVPLSLGFLVAAIARWCVIDVQTPDQAMYLIPWVDRADALGISYLKAPFTNYPPFYEHVLAVLALFPGPEVLRIKLSSIVFDVLLAWCVTALVPRPHKALAFVLTLLLPTIICNSAALGQSDSIYACAIMLALAAVLTERPVWTMLAFSVALAIKLQALIFAPVLLLLFLERRQPLSTFLLIPVAYLLFGVPMLAAGRPLDAVMLVYLRQFGFFDALSLNAPNFWMVAQQVVSYRTGVMLGLPFAIAVVGVTLLALWRSGIARRGRPEGLLLAAAILLIVVPYVTPKMHDRYFFLVDPVLVALFAANRKYLAPLTLAQTASFLAYISFPIGQSAWGERHWLLGTDGYVVFGWGLFPVIGAFLMGSALMLLIQRVAELRREYGIEPGVGLRQMLADRFMIGRSTALPTTGTPSP